MASIVHLAQFSCKLLELTAKTRAGCKRTGQGCVGSGTFAEKIAVPQQRWPPAILGTIFMALALVLAMIGKGQAPRGSILDAPASSVPGSSAPAVPALPATPSVPNN